MSTSTYSWLPSVVDRLAAAGKFTDPLLEGEKTLTARYAFEREYDPGDRVALTTPGGHVFAVAVIERMREMTVREFVEADYDGHRQYADVDECLEALEMYYPEASLSATTPLSVIFFADVVDANEYAEQNCTLKG